MKHFYKSQTILLKRAAELNRIPYQGTHYLAGKTNHRHGLLSVWGE
jgi:hypothetical protein